MQYPVISRHYRAGHWLIRITAAESCTSNAIPQKISKKIWEEK